MENELLKESQFSLSLSFLDSIGDSSESSKLEYIE